MMETRRIAGVAIVVAVVAAAGSPIRGQTVTDNVCDAGESPDIIVGELFGPGYWGTVSGIAAFAVGTYSCNIGTCGATWISNTNQHPVIGQNLFRIKDGRFEQIGQSWLKHGFYALSDELCSTGCIATNGTILGVNCADPYTASLNASQNGLGPKSDIDPTTGSFPYPPTFLAPATDAIARRLQIALDDIDPTLNPGARYLIEGQYVAADDALAGNDANNASWREVLISPGTGGAWSITSTGITHREQPAIFGWQTIDPDVTIVPVDRGAAGLLYVGARVIPLGSGFWRYVYAVHNLNSGDTIGSFEVPLPANPQISGIRFHDVPYHSGEIWDGANWPHSVSIAGPAPPSIRWTTAGTIDDNARGNSIRWGTTYSFEFVVDAPPEAGTVRLGIFESRSGETANVSVPVPRACDGDGVCEPGESCTNCPVDCGDEGPSSGFCGDGNCEGGIGESCLSCPGDCNGQQSGTPANRYCCGDGSGQNPVPCSDPRCASAGRTCGDSPPTECCGDGTCSVQETACGCPVDCGPCPCGSPLECDDGLYCNGIETCAGGFCAPGPPPCPDFCDEGADACVGCVSNDQCDDGLYCNGNETCSPSGCAAGTPPCPGQVCDEGPRECVDCLTDADCSDGIFCNGAETCVANTCAPGTDPCPGAVCDLDAGACYPCSVSCDDGLFCNGQERCYFDQCVLDVEPCRGRYCDEYLNRCELGAAVQPVAGEALLDLDAATVARFEAGRSDFEGAITPSMGLGPIYNADRCSSCHPGGSAGAVTVTHFGLYDAGTPSFDPLPGLGGSLLQTLTTAPGCQESVPAAANVSLARATRAAYGAGLVEAIPEATLRQFESFPPPGLSGRVHDVPVPELGGEIAAGRFGWKARAASVLSLAAYEARDHLGFTSSLAPVEHAPNGDAQLLASCDAVADPEDAPDALGRERVERIADYLRYQAPPPQAPRSGMTGELQFVVMGCADCHTQRLTTSSDPTLPAALRGVEFRPYSDFVLHDMGSQGELTQEGEAAPGEVRTAPLWGIRSRAALWHDGSIAGGTLGGRVAAAVARHDAPGSEAQAAAQNFANAPQGVRDAVVAFLGSLGRREFDHDGDGDIDLADFAVFASCYAPGTSYPADHPCSIGDIDRDGDVDATDHRLFVVAADVGFGGAVPDGGRVPGEPLRVGRAAGGQVSLTRGPSCAPGDTDYSVYRGELGAFETLNPALCSTGGATAATVSPFATSTFFLVVPHDGLGEGSYGTLSSGEPRPWSGAGNACHPQAMSTCD